MLFTTFADLYSWDVTKEVFLLQNIFPGIHFEQPTIKVITAMVAILLLAGNFMMLAIGYNYYKQREFFENHNKAVQYIDLADNLDIDYPIILINYTVMAIYDRGSNSEFKENIELQSSSD